MSKLSNPRLLSQLFSHLSGDQILRGAATLERAHTHRCYQSHLDFLIGQCSFLEGLPASSGYDRPYPYSFMAGWQAERQDFNSVVWHLRQATEHGR